MKPAQWLWRVSVETSPEAEDAVGELLGKLFNRPAAIYTDAETRVSTVSVFCDKPGEWSSARRAKLTEAMRPLKSSGLNAGRLNISARRIRREDWAESWKRHFKAIEIGPQLLVKPGWIRRKRRKGQAVVVLDPGLSFGTGNHPTTAFCLAALVAARQARLKQSFWDVGTGSGILAVAAAKLDYAPVEAMDFDPEAVRIAKANARRNRVSQHIRFSRQDLTRLPVRSARRFSVICANLISPLLVAEAGRLVNRLESGGQLIVAGILAPEFTGVREAFEAAGLRIVKTRSVRGWRSGTFVLQRFSET